MLLSGHVEKATVSHIVKTMIGLLKEVSVTVYGVQMNSRALHVYTVFSPEG